MPDTNPIIISSQRYIDEDIVAEKIKDNDFVVSVSPEFEIDGIAYRAVLDGHHSLAAAKEADVAPKYKTVKDSEVDYVGYIKDGKVEMFLELAYCEDAWYNVATGVDVW